MIKFYIHDLYLLDLIESLDLFISGDLLRCGLLQYLSITDTSYFNTNALMQITTHKYVQVLTEFETKGISWIFLFWIIHEELFWANKATHNFLINMLIFNVFYFQAISNPRSEIQQERAWDTVCPLVSQLKRYYEFSLALGMFFLNFALMFSRLIIFLT